MTDDPVDDAPDASVDLALDAWVALPPPAEFADRLLAAREAEVARAAGHAVAVPVRRRARFAWAAAATGVAVVGVGFAMFRTPPRAASGALIAHERTTQRLGDRGTAVAEAASDLTWHIDDRGAADVVQRTGDVFYRVERGEPFVVHTPAGDIRVTGTCFRVEVEAMNNPQKLILSGIAGAAIATAVLVTVYEGHVVAENRSAKTELAAGSTARLTPGDTLASTTIATPAAGDEARLSREQLLAMTRDQRSQLISLRNRLVELEKVPAARYPVDVAEPGRLWHDPSPELLKEWVATCHLRTDEPAVDRFEPLTGPDSEGRVTASEVNSYNATMTEVVKQWKDLIRGLYIELTGDSAGAESLSTEAMEHEIEDKSPPGEHSRVQQRIAMERAGQATAPIGVSGMSPLEQMMRAHAALGDQSEAALAKRLGPDRAHAVRGDGWQGRWETSGCPSP